MPRPVAVVCVTYNSTAHVLAMLASLADGSQAKSIPVVAVDNGSRDGTVESLREIADVTVIEQSNSGYADGINRGVVDAPVGHDILVLNADVLVQPGAIDRMSAVLEEDRDAAIVVPALRDESGASLPSLRRFPTWWRTAIEAIVGGSRAGRFGEAHHPNPGDGRQEADWATGAAMLIRRKVLDEVGPWDPSFFLYSEETEYCLRVREAGYRVVCEPQAVMTHIGGEMSRHPDLWALRAVNRVRLQRRSGTGSAVLFRAASVVFELRRALLGDVPSRAALRALLSRDLDGVAERLTRRLGGEPAWTAR